MASRKHTHGRNGEGLIRFSDLVEVNPRVDCSHLERTDHVSFIPMSDVTENGQWEIRQRRAYSEVESGYTVFRDGDILFAKITPCTENGKGCHATPLENGIGFGSTEFHVLRAREGVNPRLVYHLSVCRSVRGEAAGKMGGSAGQQRVPADFFKLLKVSRSCVENQATCAKLLDFLDDALKATDAVIDQTRDLKTALLQDLLRSGLPGRHRRYQTVKGLGTIPKGWKLVSLGSLSTLVTSGSRGWSKYVVSDGSLFVRSQNIGLGEIDLGDSVFVDPPTGPETERARIRSGDVLVSVTGEPGNVATATESLGESYVSQHVALVRLKDAEVAAWVAIALSAPFGQTQFQARMYGQTRPGLNLTDVADLVVPIPDREERDGCCELIRSVQKRLDREIRHLVQLESLKVAIAEALLTGNVCLQIEGENSAAHDLLKCSRAELVTNGTQTREKGEVV